MEAPQRSPGFTSSLSLSLSPAPRSNSNTSPAPAHPYTMTSYPHTYGHHNPSLANSSVPNPNVPSSSQPSASGHSSPISVATQPQSNNTGYLTASTPAMQTPAMGFPTFYYNEEHIDDARQGARNRFGVDAEAASQHQQALKEQYLLLLHQEKMRQQEHEQKQLYEQRRQQYQQQRLQQLKNQQQRRQQQQKLPPRTAEKQQQDLQLQTPVASPNQTSSQVTQQQQRQQQLQDYQQHNIRQHNVQQHNPTSDPTAPTTPPPPPPPTAAAVPNAPTAAPDRVNLNPILLPPPPPLIEPHPRSKSFDNLVLMHHPMPVHVVDRLSMTTACSLLRLCADFEYRDLSADYPIALTPTTKTWLAAHLRELNGARRESGRRLCERWQKCVRERARAHPTTEEIDWVQQEEVEVPGGSEEELKMLHWEAMDALGRFVVPDADKGRMVVMPLIRPGWDFLQLRQVRGPSAKEWEDFVVDGVGELRRQKENREQEEREEREARERQEGSNDGEDDDEVTIVGSRVLSSEEMQAAAMQTSARSVKQPVSKNIAAGKSKPKKVSLKETAPKKTHSRKKSAAAKAKGGKSKLVEANSAPQQTPVQTNTAPTQSAPQLSDYPPIYGEAPQSTNQNTSVAAPTIDLTASASSPPPAQMSDYPPIYATGTAVSGLPDYPPIHATSTSAPGVSDYGPVFATDGTVPGIQHATTATTSSTRSYAPSIGLSSIDDLLHSGTDGGSMATAATDASSQISSALQNHTPGPDRRNGGDVASEGHMPQVDGAFELVSFDELDDLFDGEIDE